MIGIPPFPAHEKTALCLGRAVNSVGWQSIFSCFYMYPFVNRRNRNIITFPSKLCRAKNKSRRRKTSYHLFNNKAQTQMPVLARRAAVRRFRVFVGSFPLSCRFAPLICGCKWLFDSNHSIFIWQFSTTFAIVFILSHNLCYHLTITLAIRVE